MLGLAFAVYQKKLVIFVVGNNLVEGAKNLRETKIKGERSVNEKPEILPGSCFLCVLLLLPLTLSTAQSPL